MPLMDRVDAVRARPRFRPAFVLSTALIVFIAVGYLIFVRRYTSPYAAGSDASGYLNIARLLSEGQLTKPVGPIEGLSAANWDYYFQQPLGFVVNRETGAMVPTYPVGLPLHLWSASFFVELEYAAMLVNVVLATAAGALMVCLGRQLGLPWAWTLAGAAILWACPVYMMMALQPISDVPATIWGLGALCAALSGRRKFSWALLSGIAFAMAVLVRPSNLLLLAPIVTIFGLRSRAWIAFIAGGLPGAIFLAWYNLQLYGRIVTTGYGDVSSAFSLEYLSHNLAHIAVWVPQLLSPLFVAALAGLFWARRESGAAIRLLTIWATAIIAFYAFYFHTGESWWYLRFLLPAFPALIVLGMVGANALVQHVANVRIRAVLSVVALACVLFFQLRLGRQLHVLDVKHNDTAYVQLAHWLREHAPARSVVMAMQSSGALLFYTDFTVVRWDLPPPDAQRALFAATQAAGRPVYAALFEFEEKEAFAGRLTGVWQLRVRLGPTGIWQLAPSASPST